MKPHQWMLLTAVVTLLGLTITDNFVAEAARNTAPCGPEDHPALALHKKLFSALDSREHDALRDFFCPTGDAGLVLYVTDARGEPTKLEGDDAASRWLELWTPVGKVQPYQTLISAPRVIGNDSSHYLVTLELTRSLGAGTADEKPVVRRFRCTSIVLPRKPATPAPTEHPAADPSAKQMKICHLHISSADAAPGEAHDEPRRGSPGD